MCIFSLKSGPMCTQCMQPGQHISSFKIFIQLPYWRGTRTLKYSTRGNSLNMTDMKIFYIALLLELLEIYKLSYLQNLPISEIEGVIEHEKIS